MMTSLNEDALLTYESKGGELNSVEGRLELLEKLIEIYNEYKPHKVRRIILNDRKALKILGFKG